MNYNQVNYQFTFGGDMNKNDRQDIIINRIIDAIFYYLPNKQIEEMTADEIAHKAEVSKRTLYKYFSSKKEMYLAVVEAAFKDLAGQVEKEQRKVLVADTLQQIAAIGNAYLRYCFSEPVKADLVLNYNEMYFIDEYRKRVESIQQYSNKFELSVFIRKYYEETGKKPPFSIESISLYLWSQAQGMASLMQSKKEWIKEFYQIDEEKLIEEHMEISKKILGEIK